MQIRFIMKARGSWKMKFDDLCPQISLLKTNRKRAVEMRLWHLAEYDYVKLTYKDVNEGFIDEVEIPIKA